MKAPILPALFFAVLGLAASGLADAPVLNVDDQRIELTTPVTGSEPMTYQWYRGTAKLPAPEGTQKTLVLQPPYTPGVYTCVITNAEGSVTSRKTRLSITTSTTAVDTTITVKKP